MLAVEMKTRCYCVNTVEDPLAGVLLEVQLSCQTSKVNPRRRLSGNQLHPAFIPVLKLGVLALDQEDPCAGSRIMNCHRMAQAPLRRCKPMDPALQNTFGNSDHGKIKIGMLFNSDDAFLNEFLAFRQSLVLVLPQRLERS